MINYFVPRTVLRYIDAWRADPFDMATDALVYALQLAAMLYIAYFGIARVAPAMIADEGLSTTYLPLIQAMTLLAVASNVGDLFSRHNDMRYMVAFTTMTIILYLSLINTISVWAVFGVAITPETLPTLTIAAWHALMPIWVAIGLGALVMYGAYFPARLDEMIGNDDEEDENDVPERNHPGT